MIEGERSVEREIEHRDAQAADRLRIRAVSGAPDALARSQAGEAGKDAEHDAPGFANPLVVDGIFEEERHEEDQRDGADTADPGEADLRFEFARAAGFGRLLPHRGYWRGRAFRRVDRNLNRRRRFRRGCVGRRRFRLTFAWGGLGDTRGHTQSKRRLDAGQAAVALIVAADEP